LSSFEFIFMADCQLGAYATFSGMREPDIADFAERGMRVEIVPKVEGLEWDATRYAAAIEAANALRPAFVVMGGDMIDDPNSEDQLDALLEITAGLDPAIAMRWVPGNHDIADDTVTPTRHSIDKYRETFGSDYYGFDHGDLRFLVLNTVVVDHPGQVPDQWDEQLAFLDWETERAAVNGSRVVLLGHHPLFIRQPNESDTYWNLPRKRRRIILDLARRARVRAAFAGHWHRNAIGWDGDLEMVTSGPVGYPLGTDPSGFRIVRVEPDRITHEYRPLDVR
jgi:3',5'-cyclic AMP phosphodiesterase CpdA